MKNLYLSLVLLALASSSAWAQRVDSGTLAESVKAARAKGIDASQLARVRVVAKGVLEDKVLQAAGDPGSALGAELAELRQQMVMQRLEHRNAVPRLLGASAPDSVQPRRGPARDLAGAAQRLRSRRTAVEALAADHPHAAEAISKARALESELDEIDALPPEEQASRLHDLSLRLTPRKASEFANGARVQPTLTLGRSAASDE